MAASFLDYPKAHFRSLSQSNSAPRLSELSFDHYDEGRGEPSNARLHGRKLEGKLEAILRLRRQRTKFFSENLFADPAWDILLTLGLAELQFRRMCVTRLCDAACAPSTTALRWITHLEQSGSIVRRADPLDGRRKYLELSEEASRALREYLESLDEVPALHS